MKPLRIRNSFRTVFAHGRRGALPFLYENEDSLTKVNFFYTMFITIFIAYKVVCSTYVLLEVKVFELRLYLLSTACYYSTGIFIISFFAIYSKRFVSMLGRFDELTASLLASGFGHEELLLTRYNTAAVLVTNFAKVMGLVSLFCPAIFCLSVPLFDFLEGHYRTHTAVAGQCPMELVVQGLPGVFELIVIQQVLGFFYPATQRYTMDGVMLALFRLQSSYYVFLSKTLEDIGNEVKLKGATKNFLSWIKLHQQVTSMAHELAHFFSPVIVMYYLSTIIAVAGALLYILDSKSVNFLQKFFGAMGVLTALGQLYLQCHAANDITTEGENIAFPVYSMPWTEFSSKSRDFVNMIIQIANQPIYIEGYRCTAFRLDRITCQVLLLNFVSTFMAFRKIKELNELEDGATE